jgi:hypothetical protein
MRDRNVYSHVVVHDYGFAPNPYAGILSIATCKPSIRRSAHRGDWVVGVGSVQTVGGARVGYAVLVDEIVPLEIYGGEQRFEPKRPVFRGEPWQRLGDNIYYRDDTGTWRQRPSLHNASHIPRDLSGINALLGCEFYYFGASAPELPSRLSFLASPGRGHRRFDKGGPTDELANWLRTSFKPGINGEPFHPFPHKRRIAPNTAGRADS